MNQSHLNEIETWVANPTNDRNSIDLDQSILSVQAALQAKDSDKRKLGQLLGKLKGLQRSIADMESKDWVPFSNGYLAIGHRPSKKMIVDLKLQGTTHLLTLLSEKEGGKETESLTKSQGMEWLWFPMESAKKPDESRFPELRNMFHSMLEILEQGGKIYVHCSAGIHRTGMISLAFMNYLNLSKEESLKKLAALRTETSNNVGQERADWALKFK